MWHSAQKTGRTGGYWSLKIDATHKSIKKPAAEKKPLAPVQPCTDSYCPEKGDNQDCFH